MRRFVRTLGTLLIVAGIGLLAWAFVVWRWEDPVTSLYTAYKQRQLESAFEERFEAFRPAARETVRRNVVTPRQLAVEARRYRKTLERGDAIGRLIVPRLDLNAIMVNGTDPHTLRRGPGRYLGSFLPGEGELIYVAGHRTTYGAPFADIDKLRPGDRVRVEVPYATVTYAIRRHRIVPATQLSVLRSRGVEEIALQACHPRFFATQRYIAYATPVSIVARDGRRVVTSRLVASKPQPEALASHLRKP
jgi:sortase A